MLPTSGETVYGNIAPRAMTPRTDMPRRAPRSSRCRLRAFSAPDFGLMMSTPIRYGATSARRGEILGGAADEAPIDAKYRKADRTIMPAVSQANWNG
jgi:hypothetical protein